DPATRTVGMTSQLYLESPQHLSKKPLTQRCDKRNLERVVAFLGAGRDVATLSESDVRRYTMARRKGDPSLKGVAPGKPVRDRAIELDLVLLMTALNWAARERTSAGRRSEERRVGKEGSDRGARDRESKKEDGEQGRA